MQNRNWLKSNNQQRRIFGGLITRSPRNEPPLPARWLCAVIVIVLILNLSGCASRSSVICQDPVMPQPPALSEPIPPVSFSLSVQRLLSKWEAALIGMPTTPKP